MRDRIKKRYLTLGIVTLLTGCENKMIDEDSLIHASDITYIEKLEEENNISYEKILNTRGGYIPSMCYTKTKDIQSNHIFNPCYTCHTKGKIPNFHNDTHLQQLYAFPKEMMKNPYRNLFKNRTFRVNAMSDKMILAYVRESNYLDQEGDIIPATVLPKRWKGYRPDCYFNFDDEGFDKDKRGDYTGWRAFRYYPFLGTFWPTNGSSDDVLIRLGALFRQDEHHSFNKEIYKLNFSIVEALIKSKYIALERGVDEKVYGVDLNGDGTLNTAWGISPEITSYVGLAKVYLRENKVHLSQGLFPEETEFLHSVRYLDWDEKSNTIVLSAKMKELRYAKKYSWKSYGALKRAAESELVEALSLDTSQARISVFRGNYEEGLRNETGWLFQGFIEDKSGNLRPQTHEETIACMGCHSHLGATTDSSFSFLRKFEGFQKEKNDYGWNHWSQKGFEGLKEPIALYSDYGREYEYSFYLKNNHSGNEFRNNEEVKNNFFDKNGMIKEEMLKALQGDITLLLYPSKKRALELNKQYKVIVEEQSYIYGRDATLNKIKNIYEEIKEGALTGIVNPIVKP
ncbi:MAG: hypothetical protein U9O64_05550 [Campylobacterota bacterium]|nr:hypothetical protein [Campylobacterota bacterium]